MQWRCVDSHSFTFPSSYSYQHCFHFTRFLAFTVSGTLNYITNGTKLALLTQVWFNQGKAATPAPGTIHVLTVLVAAWAAGVVTAQRIVVKVVSPTVMPKQNAASLRQKQDKLAPLTSAAQSLVSAVQLANSVPKVANPTVISRNRQALHQMFRNE